MLLIRGLFLQIISNCSMLTFSWTAETLLGSHAIVHGEDVMVKFKALPSARVTEKVTKKVTEKVTGTLLTESEIIEREKTHHKGRLYWERIPENAIKPLLLYLSLQSNYNYF